MTPAVLLLCLTLNGATVSSQPMPTESPTPTAPSAVASEEGVLVLSVTDLEDRPLPGVTLATAGDGGSATSDDNGKARLELAPATDEGDWVTLRLVRSPSGRDLVFVSPWHGRVVVPPFENESDNFHPVLLAERGDRDLLRSGRALEALVEGVVEGVEERKRQQAQLGGEGERQPLTEAERAAVLAERAAAYGLAPEEVDAALRSWATEGLYQAGLKALYEESYPEAEALLERSFRELEAEEVRVRERLVANAVALGQVRQVQGKYAEAAAAYREAVERSPNDASLLNSLGVAIVLAGGYREAEEVLEQALSVRGAVPGLGDPDVALTLNNLAIVYAKQGRYGDAGEALEQALSIQESTLPEGHPEIAVTLNNLANVYHEQGRYGEALGHYVRVLEIWEVTLGSEHPHVVTTLSNLANIHRKQGHYDEAESLYLSVLSIQESELGPEHSGVATVLNDLAVVYADQRLYDEAETYFRRALSIREATLGTEHPTTAETINNLALLYDKQGLYDAARRHHEWALRIWKTALGPEHPTVASALTNFGQSYSKQRRYVEDKDGTLKRKNSICGR